MENEKAMKEIHLAEWVLSRNGLLFFIPWSRLFASKCAKCQESFAKNELFIRTADYRRYHPDCFRCDHCDRLLVSGDEYYLHGQNQIFCREDFHQFYSSSTTSDPIGGTPTAGKETKKKKKKRSVWRAYILTSVRMCLWREGRNWRRASNAGSQISLGCSLFTLDLYRME